MKKRIIIISSIILILIVGILVKINSELNKISENFNSEHSLNESSINILAESISPDKKYKYYEYQFDNGGLGYSRVFWSVIKNEKNLTDLKEGIIPNGYKIVKWKDDNVLVLKKWKPYYESNSNYNLNQQTEFNGIKIEVTD